MKRNALDFASGKPLYKGAIDWFSLWEEFDAYYAKRHGNERVLDDNKKTKIKNLVNKQLRAK